MITASLCCDTKPLLNIAEYSVLLTDVTTVGTVGKLVWAFFALPVFGCKNVLFFLCLLQHFACMLYKFGCLWFLKMFLEMGTAFSEHGILMSLNFPRAVFRGPLVIMWHVWTVMLVIFLNKTECIWNIARWTNKLLGEMCTLWHVSYKSVCLLLGFFSPEVFIQMWPLPNNKHFRQRIR